MNHHMAPIPNVRTQMFLIKKVKFVAHKARTTVGLLHSPDTLAPRPLSPARGPLWPTLSFLRKHYV